MLFILIYSIRGGVKTIIWTDTLQTFFLIASLVLTVVFLNRNMNFNLWDSVHAIASSKYSQVFFWDYHGSNFFVKQFFSGMFITIAMTGLDQDLMQKNLTCRTLKDAQKNMMVFSIILIFVNLLFLAMGALMYMFAQSKGISTPAVTDNLLLLLPKIICPLLLNLYF